MISCWTTFAVDGIRSRGCLSARQPRSSTVPLTPSPCKIFLFLAPFVLFKISFFCCCQKFFILQSFQIIARNFPFHPPHYSDTDFHKSLTQYSPSITVPSPSLCYNQEGLTKEMSSTPEEETNVCSACDDPVTSGSWESLLQGHHAPPGS